MPSSQATRPMSWLIPKPRLQIAPGGNSSSERRAMTLRTSSGSGGSAVTGLRRAPA